ncbi:MAG: LamG domain-containing protein [Phycisphaerales bacterium]|nr:LamG domain-containing protein [Phycisphaerales bacterium]
MAITFALPAANGAAQGFGRALSFDGNNDQVRSNSNFDCNQLTVEAWVLVRSFAPIGWGGLAAWGRDADASWEVDLHSNGAVYFKINWNKANQRNTSSIGMYVANQWSHVAITYDGSDARLYSNGHLVRSETLGKPISSGGSGAWLTLGNNFPGADEFSNASFDEVRIWNIARTENEILCDMRSTLSGSEPGLLAYYDFDEVSGQIVPDRSVNHRDAFLGYGSSADSGDPVRVDSTVPSSCFDLSSPAPQLQSVCPSGSAEIAVVARACEAIAYQWQYEPIPGTWLDAADGPTFIDGGTITLSSVHSDRLQLSLNTTPNTPLIRFRCIVTNSCGSTTSEPATLVPCPPDLTCDNVVDDADFVVFVAAYNVLDCADPAMAAGCPADLNGDGLLDDSDFVEFVAAYNALGCL